MTSGSSPNSSLRLVLVFAVGRCSKWDFPWHIIVRVTRCSYSDVVSVHWLLVRCSNVVLFGFVFLVECIGYVV